MELLLLGLVALAFLAGGKKNGNGQTFDTDDSEKAGFQDKEIKGKKTWVPDQGKASGNPPNISGDPDGYNTERWPNTQAACMGGGALGYAFYPDCSAGNLTSNLQFTKAIVKKFQGDYNKIALHPGWGGIRGKLDVDGVVGVNTFNAMEAAELMGFPWMAIVEGLPPPGY